MKTARRGALLALALSAAWAAPAAAVQPGDVILVRGHGWLYARFPGVSRGEWRNEIAGRELVATCYAPHGLTRLTLHPPRTRHTLRFLPVGGADWCVVGTLDFVERPDQELAVRGFTAEGRRLVDERSAARRAAQALILFNRVQADSGRYPTDEELAAFSRDEFPVVRLATPDAAPPANGAAVFLDSSIDRVRAVAVGGGRTLFIERVGTGDDATFSTNALRWYDELVGGQAI